MRWWDEMNSGKRGDLESIEKKPTQQTKDEREEAYSDTLWKLKPSVENYDLMALKNYSAYVFVTWYYKIE